MLFSAMKIKPHHNRYLYVGGEIRLGTKADLLECLEVEKFQVANAPIVDVKLLDGAAVVQMLNPGAVKTFQEYTDTIFLPYVRISTAINSQESGHCLG